MGISAPERRELLKALYAQVRDCTRCPLHVGRTNAVFGAGNADAELMFIGEAPGEQEDTQGRPFVGAAGKLLTELLTSIGLKREEVFITNIVKCRPPDNRPPRKDESLLCKPYLDRQLKLVSPRIICPMGNSAIRTIMSLDQSVSELHGVPFEIGSTTYLPMYHPAAALYTFSLRRVMEEDCRKLKGLLESLD